MGIRSVFTAITAVLCAVSCAAQEAPPVEGLTAYAGASIIDGTGVDPIENGVLIVRDGRIEAVGATDAVEIPPGAIRVEVTGKTIIPGLINTHGHVGDSRGMETGQYSEENVLRQLRLYARYGVTTVNSLGGDGKEGIRVRDMQDTPDLDRARLFVAGSVVTGDTPEAARGQVDKNARMNVDFIKIRVDDFLGRSAKMKPEAYQAVIDQAHTHNLPVAIHLFYLEDAKGVARAGGDYIAHSVRDLPVDAELIDLLRSKDIPYCPTLTREVSTFVYEDVPDFFADPFFLKEADPADLEQLKAPERRQRVKDNPTTARYKQALEIAKTNLKKLADAGVRIAFGTDTGPPGRFQGYFEHMEIALMAEAGLTPMQILVSATGDAAKSIRRDDIGTLEPGRWADFLILNGNPLDDVKYFRSIDSVWIAGNRAPAQQDANDGP